MNYRALGKTGLKVSEIGFGCGNVGGLMVRGTPQDRLKTVSRAIDLGINYFDTAPSYGDGLSETNLGKVLKELKPDVYVGTKVRLNPQDVHDSRRVITQSVNESLKRMDRKYVDLIQLHSRIRLPQNESQDGLSSETVIKEVVGAFEELGKEGKVRFYGITGLGDTDAVHKVVESESIHTVQACFNLLNPSGGTDVPPNFYVQSYRRLIDKASGKRMGVIAIRILAAGALSGVEERHPVAAPSVPPIGSGPDYAEDVKRSRNFDFLVREGYVDNLVEAAVRFAVGKKEISTVLIGYSSIDQLEKAVEYASRGPLPTAATDRFPQIWAQFVKN